MSSPDLLREEIGRVHAYWLSRVASEELTAGTAARYRRVFASFIRFVTAQGCERLVDVDANLCRAFIHAARRGGAPTAISTSRFRLTVIRDAYKAMTSKFTLIHDPTDRLRVAQSPQVRAIAPLTPGEADRLRAAGRIFPRDRMGPSAVELSLVGASHAEIASAVVADLDLRGERVWLGARWVALDAFAAVTLTGRVADCRRAARRTGLAWDPRTTAIALPRPLSAYPESSIAPSISSRLGRTMRSAGLTRLGLRPASLREYAANREYARTWRIEAVAELLGLDSLDVARGFVDPEWQRAHADEVRA